VVDAELRGSAKCSFVGRRSGEGDKLVGVFDVGDAARGERAVERRLEAGELIATRGDRRSRPRCGGADDVPYERPPEPVVCRVPVEQCGLAGPSMMKVA
jgi:hypothetical protein